VDGAFVVDEASDDPTRFEVGASLYVEGTSATIVLTRRVGKGRRAIKLDRSAERGSELSVPRDALPSLEEGSFYVADLVGLEVLEAGGRRLGVVRDVVSGIANDNLELDSGALVPLVEDAVVEIDLQSGTVHLNRGYID
jgi:16S rRNA processing protein RimM